MPIKITIEHLTLALVIITAIMSGTWFLSHQLTKLEVTTGILVIRVDKLENDIEQITYEDRDTGDTYVVSRSVRNNGFWVK